MDDQLTATERRALDAWTAMEPPPGFADRVIDRELDGERVAARQGRRLATLAIIGACVAAAAVIAVVVTRRGSTEPKHSTPIVEPAARPPAPAPAPARTGIHVETLFPFEVRAPYATTWVVKAPITGDIEPGSGLRFKDAAQVTAWDTTIGISGPAVVQLDAPSNFDVESGEVNVQATALVSARFRGGSVMLHGPAEARIAVEDGAATIDWVVGLVRVRGKQLEHTAVTGDVVVVKADGGLRLMSSSPTEVDVQVGIDASITIHDPRPPTAVQFQLASVCPAGGVVQMAADSHYGLPQTGGKGAVANLLIGAGKWVYWVRCWANGKLGAIGKPGYITVVRDPATRALPTIGDVQTIDADGRNYRISYQSQVPSLQVRATGPGTRFTLRLAGNGIDELFGSETSVIAVPGTKLRAGTYTYSIDRDGVRDPTTSTLTIELDASAPQVRLEPTDLSKQVIELRGAALPGWQLSIDGVALPLDDKGRFVARIGPLTSPALAVRAEHAQHGVRYYLRRPR